MRTRETVPTTRLAALAPRARRRGISLWGVLAGALLVTAALTMLVSLGAYYRQLATPCPPARPCFGSALTVVEAEALTSVGVSPDAYAALVFLTQLITNVGFLAAGALLFWRRRSSPIVLSTVCVLALLPIAMSGYLLPLIDQGGTGVGVLYAAIIASNSAIILFFALFPTGSFTPRMLVWYAPLLIALNAAAIVVASADGVRDLSSPLSFVMQSVWMASMLVAQLYRYLRVSSPDERRQTRWMVAALVTFVAYKLGLGWFSALAGMRPDSEWLALVSVALTVLMHMLQLLIFVGVVATLRRGLYNLERVVGRTLVYALLTLCVMLLYVLLVGGLSLLLQPSSNTLVALLATGIIAAAVQPLRDALQRSVNQLFFGRRDDPREVIAALGRQLEHAVAPDAVLATIVHTLAHELRLPYAALVLDHYDESAAASVGAPAEPLLVLPLTDAGVVIGRLIVAARSPDEPFTADELRLLKDLVRQAGVAVRAAQLNHELQRSRERLVAAREEERRRLQRDLHNELGPNLASMSMQLDAARTLLGPDPEAGETLLAEVQAQLKDAVGTVRQLVHGLRPPLLDQLGLLGALRECALRVERGAQLQVSLELPERLPPLSAAVESAAYYIVAEALNNVARHARARRCTVRLELGSELRVEVCDDGAGLPAQVGAGVGLRSMRERAQELSGTCRVTRAAGGTMVRACLPVGP